MKPFKLPVLIMSSERSEYLPDVNESRTEALRQHIAGTGRQFWAANGKYKGQTERSFAVELHHDETGADFFIDQAVRTAHRYGQESILYVNMHGMAYLVPTDTIATAISRAEPIGQWLEVSAERAAQNDAYTEIDGHYYITTGAF